MTNIIPFAPPPKPEPPSSCSFCKRPKAEVRRLITSETDGICDQCLAQATERLKEES